MHDIIADYRLVTCPTMQKLILEKGGEKKKKGKTQKKEKKKKKTAERSNFRSPFPSCIHAYI